MTARVIDIEPVLTVKEFAEAVGYSPWTINKFCRMGKIQSKRRSGGGKGSKRLIPASEVDHFLRAEEL